MKQELIDRIKESNKSCSELEAKGYLPQGRTKNMKQVALLSNGRLFFFNDYIEAKRELLTNNRHETNQNQGLHNHN